MYRLDIMTDEGTFTVHEDEIKTGADVGEHLRLVDTISDIEAVNFFKGYPPHVDRETEALLCCLGKDIKIKGYVLYPYVPAPKVEEPVDRGPVEGEVVPFTMRADYLGNKLTVTGIELYQGGIFHFQPIKVNGEPQVLYIKPAALQQLLAAWAEAERGLPVTDYLVVIPDVDMNYITASDYLMDYVGNSKKERAGSNAKAWNGWRPGSDE